MAYDVLKKIGGREYRYRVESYRDPETGRVRNRWTYIGRASDEAPVVKRRRPAPQTRNLLIEAFLRLIDRTPWGELTAGAIAVEAGVAHGTFYRYFHDRQELLDHCTRRANEMLDARLVELTAIAPTVDQERARLRAWVVDLMRRPVAPAGLMRTWSELALASLRRTRRRARIAAFSAYIAALRERSYAVALGEPRPLAIALTFQLEMLSRRTAHEQALLSEDEYLAAAETFDRLLFWRPP
ncbi:TetR/AcrR family transcriptional regulator [bacterium]|nr:MAG: TetR/AcrR family transcriptional regulator [bacterium]